MKREHTPSSVSLQEQAAAMSRLYSLPELWEKFKQQCTAEGHDPDFRHFELWLNAVKPHQAAWIW